MFLVRSETRVIKFKFSSASFRNLKSTALVGNEHENHERLGLKPGSGCVFLSLKKQLCTYLSLLSFIAAVINPSSPALIQSLRGEASNSFNEVFGI